MPGRWPRPRHEGWCPSPSWPGARYRAHGIESPRCAGAAPRACAGPRAGGRAFSSLGMVPHRESCWGTHPEPFKRGVPPGSVPRRDRRSLVGRSSGVQAGTSASPEFNSRRAGSTPGCGLISFANNTGRLDTPARPRDRQNRAITRGRPANGRACRFAEGVTVVPDRPRAPRRSNLTGRRSTKALAYAVADDPEGDEPG